jgi:hypothetical protein
MRCFIRMVAVAILADVRAREGRRGQVLGILRQSGVALDDDQIAEAAQMNRVYVNVICRQLAAEGLLDTTESTALDYYLVLTGPPSAAASSRGTT